MKMNQLAGAPQLFSSGEGELANLHSLKPSEVVEVEVYQVLK
jgi:hypothetical protein